MTARATKPGEDRRELSVDKALDFAAAQVRALVTAHPGAMPTYTRDGRWVMEADPWAPSWNGGFLTGLLWIFARRTGDSWFREQAELYSLRLEGRKSDRGTHDVGFVLEPSWGRWYDVEPSDRVRDVLIEGGRTMALRLQNAGGYLSTWVDPGSTFIDVMMNVGIILRAAEYSGDAVLREVALRHCRTSMRYLMRGDGSTAHEGWFDTASGEFLRTATHQGWRSDSSWARGQAWAIYGFATAHRHTAEPDLLDAACRAADYYIDQTPEGGVPPNDWADPAPAEPWEASAAAIAATGLLQLADQVGTDGAGYRSYAMGILRTLRSPEFVAVDTPGWQGILQHATYHHRRGIGVDESVMFGDYYFVEALDAASRIEVPE
jgi:unsaturated chondroitin disaccharide hydrolase